MQLKKSMYTFICTLTVFLLCFVNTTYAWESMEQSAVNITAGDATQVPDEPDKPDTPDKPSDPEKPDTPDEPGDSEKPDDSKKPTVPDKPEKKPENSLNQTGKNDADTGDTHQFLRYLLLMLSSFILMIAIGVTMIVSTINIVENRRR